MILLFTLILGCNKRSKQSGVQKLVRFKNKNMTEKAICNVIIKLNESNDSVNGYKFIDSLIRYNGNTGFIYFEEGMIDNYYSHFTKSIEDFKKAQEFHYSERKCQIMINVSKSMMNP